MMKRFIKGGLGDASSPFSADGSQTVSDVGNTIGTPLKVVVDAVPSSATGNKHGRHRSIFKTLKNSSDNAVAGAPDLPASPPPSVLGDVKKISSPFKENTVSFVPNVQPQLFSKESGYAPYESLYHDFKLGVVPVYNFWTDDETQNDTEEKGSRDLSEIPRYNRIIWSAAPNLPPSEEDARNKQYRPANAVKIGLELVKGHGVSFGGKNFAPIHLQPQGFSVIKNSLANGHVTPGVISSNVELPAENTVVNSDVIKPVDQSVHINEDLFLTDPLLKGISVHELKSNLSEVTNGLLDTGWLTKTPIGPNAQAVRSTFFDGKFSVDRSISGFGSFKLKGVQASSPALSLGSKVTKSVGQKSTGVDSVDEMFERVGEPLVVIDVAPSVTNRVKFVNPAIDGSLAKNRINLMTEPHHAESVISVSHVISNLDILSRTGFSEQTKKLDAPSFPAPSGLKPLEYIGYVIEKYVLDDSGAYTKIEEIDITNREIEEYVDTKVKYGSTYRYRIRSILRWTRPANVSLQGIDPFTFGQFGSQTQGLAPFKSSYFGSEWSQNWSYATIMDQVPPPPPDELTVRPDSSRKCVMVTAKFPENSQLDIAKMRLFRKLQDESGNDLVDWQQIGNDFPPRNVLFYDTDVDFFQANGTRYVYTAQSVSQHWEYSTYADQLGCRLNEKFKVFGEFPVDFVSSSGVKREYFGAFSVIPPRRTKAEVVVVPESDGGTDKTAQFNLTGRENLGNGSRDDKDYVVRVESLDTGEVVDFRLGTRYENMPPSIAQLPIRASVHHPQILSKVSAQRKRELTAQTIISAPPSRLKDILPIDRPDRLGETSSGRSR